LGLLCLKWGLLWLGVGDDADDDALLLELLQSLLELLWLLGGGCLVLGESSLGIISVLVEPALRRFGDVAGPDGVCWLDTLWSLNVSDDTGTNHGGRIQDSSSLHDLLYDLLVCTLLLNETHDVGASSLVADEAGEVAGLSVIILGEGFDMGTSEHARFLGEEPQVTLSAL